MEGTVAPEFRMVVCQFQAVLSMETCCMKSVFEYVGLSKAWYLATYRRRDWFSTALYENFLSVAMHTEGVPLLFLHFYPQLLHKDTAQL